MVPRTRRHSAMKADMAMLRPGETTAHTAGADAIIEQPMP